MRRCIRIVRAAALVSSLFPSLLLSQTAPVGQAPGPFARIAIMRARDESHSVDLEAGYVRHLAWDRCADSVASSRIYNRATALRSGQAIRGGSCSPAVEITWRDSLVPADRR